MCAWVCIYIYILNYFFTAYSLLHLTFFSSIHDLKLKTNEFVYDGMICVPLNPHHWRVVLFTVLPTPPRFGFCMHTFWISPMICSYLKAWKTINHLQNCIQLLLFHSTTSNDVNFQIFNPKIYFFLLFLSVEFQEIRRKIFPRFNISHVLVTKFNIPAISTHPYSRTSQYYAFDGISEDKVRRKRWRIHKVDGFVVHLVFMHKYS